MDEQQWSGDNTMSADKTPIAERYAGEYKKNLESVLWKYDAGMICRVIEELSAAEQRERVLRDAANEFRDAVLNQRSWFEEPCLDNDQTNAVLGAFDDTIGAALAPEQPAAPYEPAREQGKETQA